MSGDSFEFSYKLKYGETCEIYANDRWITTGLLVMKYGVRKETTRTVLEKDLRERKIWTRFVVWCNAFLKRQQSTFSKGQLASAAYFSDSFLFLKIRFALKEGRFDGIQGIQHAKEDRSKKIPVQDFHCAFEHHLHHRCKRCIEFTGDYFETVKKNENPLLVFF